MMVQTVRCMLNYIRRVGGFRVSTITIYQSSISSTLKARTAEYIRLAFNVVFVKNAPISIAGTRSSISNVVVLEPPMSVRTARIRDFAIIVVYVPSP
jgi:hypothetical protein